MRPTARSCSRCSARGDVAPEAAANARDAMARLRRAVDPGLPYHVALFDMCMPEEDGTSLGRRIKADHAFNPTKIIMVTSLGNPPMKTFTTSASRDA